MAKLAAGFAVALFLGMIVGKEIGASMERRTIASECKYGESFTVKRTGFECRRK